jgi:hypothetical protein
MSAAQSPQKPAKVQGKVPNHADSAGNRIRTLKRTLRRTLKRSSTITAVPSIRAGQRDRLASPAGGTLASVNLSGHRAGPPTRCGGDGEHFDGHARLIEARETLDRLGAIACSATRWASGGGTALPT